MIRRIFAYATSDARPRFFGTRDEMLHVVPPGKVLVSGRVWRGDLEPVLDVYMEQLAPLKNGLTLGRTLSAEEVPAALDLGRAWLGDLQAKILAASADFASAHRPEEAGAEPGTDVAEVLGNLEHLRRQMGTGDPAAVADGVHRLRDAAQRVTDSLRRRTGDAARHIGDFSKPVSIASINAANRTHAARNPAPTVDDSGRMNWRPSRPVRTADSARVTALRDAEHAVHAATTPSGLLGAINTLNRLKATRDGDPLGPAALIGRPPAQTPAALNALHRAFWATR